MATTVIVGGITPDLKVLGNTQQFIFNQNLSSIQFDNIFVPTPNIPAQNNFETRNNNLSGYRWVHKTLSNSTTGTLTLQSFVNASPSGNDIFTINEDNSFNFNGNVPDYRLTMNNTNPAAYATGLVTLNNGNLSSAFGFNNSTNEAYVWSYGTAALKFGTNATERMRIMADGTMKITTALPDFEININNTNPAAYANGLALLNNGTLSAEFGFNNSTSEAYAWAYGNSTLKFGTSATQRMKIEANGNIGMGPAFVPDQILSVNGNASKVGGGSWATYSDERVKTVVGNYTQGLNQILQLIPKKYHYNAISGYAETALEIERIGLVAQEVEHIIPECITQLKTERFEDLRVYDSSAILYMLINAVKELHDKFLESKKSIKIS